MMRVNYIYLGNCVDFLNSLDLESVNTFITSPPYWTQRDYGIEATIWDGKSDCEHFWFDSEVKNTRGDEHYTGKKRWQHVAEEAKEKGKPVRDIIKGTWEKKPFISQFCVKCNAWKGVLGLEPTYDLFIKHLCDIYDLVWKALKKTGTNWVNFGDSYGTGTAERTNTDKKNKVMKFPKGNDPGRKRRGGIKGYEKCLLMLPQRFAIEMTKRGWILRNIIIWRKPNPMPSSARDRFTVDFEYVFFFVKTNKTQYWINEKTYLAVSKYPPGTHGVENVDWEWRVCKNCIGTGIEHEECKECNGEGWDYNTYLIPAKCLSCDGRGYFKKENKCNSCKGLGKKKHNYWRGHKYYFEQIREPLADDPETYMKKITRKKPRKGIKGDTLEQGKASKEGGWNEYLMKSDVYIPLGKNKRTVWSIPTYGNPEAHFATFPPKLVIPMIKSGCPKFICKKCGLPRQKLYEIRHLTVDQLPKDHPAYRPTNPIQYGEKMDNVKSIFVNKGPGTWKHGRAYTSSIFAGYSDCKCNAGFKPGIVVDHFAGTGTTLIEAWRLGRKYIGCEISRKYYEIMNRKLDITKTRRLDDYL